MDLRQAVLDNNVEAVTRLLDTGVDVNYVNPADECAALHFAAALGNIDILTTFLQHSQVQVDIQNQEGNTPLHVSAARGLLHAAQLLIQCGANPFIRNIKDKRPIDYATGEMKNFLAMEMSNAPESEAVGLTAAEKAAYESSLPTDYAALKTYTVDFMSKHMQFQDRVKEALMRLIEEKHVALHRYRLLEQAAGLVDKDQSDNFVNQLVYLQQENEKQTADLVYYKNTVIMLKTAALQHEDMYQRNLADIIAQHNEQLQAMINRAEETERIFMEFQKRSQKDLSELSKLRAENATLKSKISVMGEGGASGNESLSEKLQSEIANLNARVQELMTENMTLQEKLKSHQGANPTQRQPGTRSSQMVQAQSDTAGRTIQDELLTMEEIRKKQDDEDEVSGKLVFVRGDGDVRQIKGGTIEKLVERLTDGVTYDSQFQQAFMLTFRAFMKQENLLDLMIQRYDLANEDPLHPGMAQPIRLRVCNTLKYWMENFWFDFNDNMSLYEKSFDFVLTKVAKDSPKMSDQLNRLMERKRRGSEVVTIQRKDNQPKPYYPRAGPRKISADTFGKETLTRDQRAVSILGMERFYDMVQSKLRGDMPEEFIDGAMRITDLEPVEVARQLTLIEYELFRAIKPTEFLDQAWLKEDKAKQAPGICEMANWSTKVTKWVIGEIVSIQDSPRARAMILEKFIVIAQHLERMNNYNGVMEILAAFQSSAVHRLKKSTQAVGSRHLKILDELMKLTSRELNYKNLRSKVHGANPPLIPFPGVYLGDLVFLDTGNSMFLNSDKNMVNFQKFQKLASYILELQVYQQTPYNFAPVPEIQSFIKEAPILDDDSAYNMSLICEPRQAMGRGSQVMNLKG